MHATMQFLRASIFGHAPHLERKVDPPLFVLADVDQFRRPARLSMICLNCISAGWQSCWQSIVSIRVRDREIGMLDDSNVSKHPRVHVALEAKENIGVLEDIL
jgi:hypothetical protein